MVKLKVGYMVMPLQVINAYSELATNIALVAEPTIFDTTCQGFAFMMLALRNIQDGFDYETPTGPVCVQMTALLASILPLACKVGQLYRVLLDTAAVVVVGACKMYAKLI